MISDTVKTELRLSVLQLGLRNPDSVRRDPTHMYCHINSGMPSVSSCLAVNRAVDSS